MSATAKLDLGAVVRGTGRTCRERWRLLLVGAVVVFVPLGLLDALDARLQDLDLERLDDVAFAGVVAFALGHAGAALAGEVFYSGVVAAGVSESRSGGSHTLRGIARSVPYWRLAVVDVAFALLVGVGLVLLIVPGVAFFVWFVIAGPVVKIEQRRPLDALRRSRRLVRGNFWRVFAVVVPLELATDALVKASGTAGHAVLGDSLVAEWAGSTLGGVIATPLWAAAIVVVTYELIGLDRAAADDPAPAR